MDEKEFKIYTTKKKHYYMYSHLTESSRKREKFKKKTIKGGEREENVQKFHY